jgi:DNA replication protein DnaC
MILTSNLAFGSWDETSAGDPVGSTTVFDRIMAISQIGGKTYRHGDAPRDDALGAAAW